MITVSIIDSRLRAALDAEGSDYYRDDLDVIPAINYAVERLVSIVEAAYGMKKISDEIFADLSKTDVYQTSSYSRVQLDTDSIWTILSVWCNITTYPPNQIPFINSPISYSTKMTALAFTGGANQCLRSTVEEWSNSKKNPFRSGSQHAVINDVQEYAYLSISNYQAAGPDAYYAHKEIEISPSVSNQFVGITYALMPIPVASTSDQVQFPMKVTNLLVDLALSYIARKQGDQTTIEGTSDKDISELIKAMN